VIHFYLKKSAIDAIFDVTDIRFFMQVTNLVKHECVRQTYKWWFM